MDRHGDLSYWIPVPRFREGRLCVGMTMRVFIISTGETPAPLSHLKSTRSICLDPRVRGDDELRLGDDGAMQLRYADFGGKARLDGLTVGWLDGWAVGRLADKNVGAPLT